MTIHKEGYVILSVLTLVLLGLNFGLYYGLGTFALWQQGLVALSVVFYLLVLQFFRNPIFKISAEDKQVLAPADGKVVVIEETTEGEYFKEGSYRQISIFMSPLNVHVNRTPIAGDVEYFKYHPGKFLVAWHPKSSTENERTTMVVKHANGTELLVRQIAGAVARRIRWYVDAGTKLAHGEEFGFIKFGSRVDIFLPLDAEVNVELNQKTKGGRTVIATLP
jgi:phosphatidylserine decarboxylase